MLDEIGAFTAAVRAARMLVRWGRTPRPFGRLTAPGGSERMAALHTLLAGY